MPDNPSDLHDLRRFLVEVLEWVQEEPTGLSFVTSAVPLAEVDDDGIPWCDYPGRYDEIRGAAARVVALGCEPRPLLLLLQRRSDLAEILPEAIVLVDVLLGTANESAGATVPIDLSPTQTAIYDSLTNDFASAVDIAIQAKVSDSAVRHELPDLMRMGLVEHKTRSGYRRR